MAQAPQPKPKRAHKKESNQMRTKDIYPSKYLKAEDVDEGGMVVTIDDFVMEEVGRAQERKAVVYFKDCKPLVCNVTNKDTLGTLLGDDTDDWLGKQVGLFTPMVTYQGKTKPAVRVQQTLPPEAEFGTEDEAAFG